MILFNEIMKYNQIIYKLINLYLAIFFCSNIKNNKLNYIDLDISLI